jgi:hypothetical protein
MLGKYVSNKNDFYPRQHTWVVGFSNIFIFALYFKSSKILKLYYKCGSFHQKAYNLKF